MKSKPLLLNGKPFDPQAPRDSILKLAKWLDEHEGNVYTGRELRRQRVAHDHITLDFAQSPRHQDYVYKEEKRTIFGTPSAIQEYRRIIAAGGQ